MSDRGRRNTNQNVKGMASSADYYDKTRYLLWHNTLFIVTKYAVYYDKTRYLLWHNTLFIVTIKHAIHCDKHAVYCDKRIIYYEKARYLLW